VGIHGDGAGAGGRGFHVITSSLDPAGPQIAAGSSALAAAIRDAMTPSSRSATTPGATGSTPGPTWPA
jgi:N-acetylmuramoyl-L-alanine amidase